jgi:predicted phage terminase large subunit-like protein
MMDCLALRDALKPRVDLAAQESFLSFVRKEAPKMIPDFVMGRHIELLCSKLQSVVEGECKRLMVFLPPRSTKSVICSMLFPAWYMGHYPAHEIMALSHSDQLASDFGRSVRDIVNDEDFQEMFNGVQLRADVKAAGKWMTNKGGKYYAAGVRSKLAGRGAHVAILDDVMSEDDSFSEAGRRYIKEWYPSGLRTRIMPNGSIIIINTRYHYDDICGWLLKQESDNSMTNKWEVVKIPAWLDEDAAELLEMEVGSSYFPEWKSNEMLQVDEEEIKASNGTRYWNALYMQDPQPDEGGIIKKKWFQWWDQEDPPSCEFIIQTYDTAFSTAKTADFSVIQTWGIFGQMGADSTGTETWIAHMILLSNIKERFEYPELRRKAQEMHDLYRPDICIIEKKASGQSLLQDLRRAGLPVLDYLPDRDKVSRVYASTPLMESGRVWLPEGQDWALDLYEEAITFPNAAHDDQVDAMTMGIQYMRDSWNILHPEDPNYDEFDEGKPKKRAYWKV